MSKIDTTAWGEFKLVDLFKRIELGKCSNAGILTDGTIPYIAASFASNGFVRGVTDSDESLTSDGNCIALICDGNGGIGRNTYQAQRFVGSSNLLLAYHPKLNKWNALFLTACLDKSVERYNYSFSWKRWGDALQAETVFIPITPEGEPDWDYMEHAMREVTLRQEEELNMLLAAGAAKPAIDTSVWQEFKLTDLFDISMGSGLDFGKMLPSEGNDAVAFVGRTGMSNGVVGLVHPVVGAKLYEAGAMTVALGGSIGACFVQKRIFHTSQNVAVLEPKYAVTDNIKLFLATLIQTESSLNYRAFVRELNAHLRRDFSIPLPIDADGVPDWHYMERKMAEVTSEREAALDILEALTGSEDSEPGLEDRVEPVE